MHPGLAPWGAVGSHLVKQGCVTVTSNKPRAPGQGPGGRPPRQDRGPQWPEGAHDGEGSRPPPPEMYSRFMRLLQVKPWRKNKERR